MIIQVDTSDTDTIKPFAKKLQMPRVDSHKGQNGKVMIIGGSSLFHSAIIWAADVASYFVDMVHIASTKENNCIIKSIKTKWRNGIVISQKDISSYIEEDDVVMIGSGMMRGDKRRDMLNEPATLTDVLKIKDDSQKTYWLTKLLLHTHHDKKWVIDAGSLQVMEKDWLKKLDKPAVITPHAKEFQMLFGIEIQSLTESKKIEIVQDTAKRFNSIILLKSVYDIVSDGDSTVVIRGGNAGLTKGGTGDVLAGTLASLYATNEPLLSSVIASYLLKKTADVLYKEKGYWFNNQDIIPRISLVLNSLFKH
ncbi:MAG: NAD(P)H-hydrate dehydratase [Patescibacteria group bacterium]